MIFSVSQYVLAVEHFNLMARTLASREIYAIYEDGNTKLKCSVGNSVLVFKVMCEGRKMAMRIYMKPHRNLRAIYGENYYPKELLVSSDSDTYGLADVVMSEWHEGVSLQSKIEEVADKPVKMEALSQMFEKFAIELLNEKWAHGDLKPENIILSKDGLHLIDFDAMYREGFTVKECVEIGTKQFQHPLRDSSFFNKSIDDYPIALIVTALAALSLDKSLAKEVIDSDYLLIRPSLAVAGCDKMLDRIETLFAECGDVRHYRIARLLRSALPILPPLKSLLELTVREVAGEEPLVLEYYNGYWGFTRRGIFVIPPMYDLAFDYSEGVALVRVGDVWHFIDEHGRVVITCGRGKEIKPFTKRKKRAASSGSFLCYYQVRAMPSTLSTTPVM